jgi:DNA-binding transcriptional ArsR family regulator
MFSSVDGEAPAPQPQHMALAEILDVLASPVRLALLQELRTPKTLREIGVRTPAPGVRDERAERPISRQAIREHLDRLAEIGVVTARDAERSYGPTVEYVLNQQKVFAISEEFRTLARLRQVPELASVTVEGVAAAKPYHIQGPCLVLVKGLDEGRSFELRPPTSGKGEWVIGRKRGLAVPLDFDPFVSTENAVVTSEGGRFFLRDLPESRNGTMLNFRALPKGGTQELRTGALIGVGRTLLMFQG